MINNLSQLWQDEPHIIVGGVAMLVVAFISVYLWWHEHGLRKHLIDLKPEKRLAYIMHQWQLRNYQIIFGLVIIASLAIAYFPYPSHQPAVTPRVEAPIITPSPAAPSPTVIEPQAPPAHSDPIAVLDMFDHTHWLADEPPTLEGIKSRYENALIGAYVLHQCNRSSSQEIDYLLQALAHDIDQLPELTSLDPQTLYRSIVSAAEGSFEMVYHKTDCTDATLDTLEQQFAHFILQYQASSSPAEMP